MSESITQMMRFQQIVEEARSRPQIGDRLVEQVPQMAWHRLEGRRAFYRCADFSFFCAVFCLIVALNLEGWVRWLNLFSFSVNIVLIFLNEFRARAMTRQLHRRAAEQLARDVMGIKG